MLPPSIQALPFPHCSNHNLRHLECRHWSPPTTVAFLEEPTFGPGGGGRRRRGRRRWEFKADRGEGRVLSGPDRIIFAY